MTRSRIRSLTAAGTTTVADTVARAPARDIPCVADDTSCSALVPLGGGTGNARTAIHLTGTVMDEPMIDVATEHTGTYSISDAVVTIGGSVSTFTLNVVESAPEGATIGMTVNSVQ